MTSPQSAIKTTGVAGLSFLTARATSTPEHSDIDSAVTTTSKAPCRNWASPSRPLAEPSTACPAAARVSRSIRRGCSSPSMTRIVPVRVACVAGDDGRIGARRDRTPRATPDRAEMRRAVTSFFLAFQPIRTRSLPCSPFSVAFNSTTIPALGTKRSTSPPEVKLTSPRLSPWATDVRHSATSSGDAMRANSNRVLPIAVASSAPILRPSRASKPHRYQS